jgi:hypothetical protein
MRFVSSVFLPLLTFISLQLGMWYPHKVFLLLEIQGLCLFIGLNLLAYDRIGLEISKIILNDGEHPLTLLITNLLIGKDFPNTYRQLNKWQKHIYGTALGGIYIGNSTMTPAGVAILIVSMLTQSTFVLYNLYRLGLPPW